MEILQELPPTKLEDQHSPKITHFWNVHLIIFHNQYIVFKIFFSRHSVKMS